MVRAAPLAADVAATSKSQLARREGGMFDSREDDSNRGMTRCKLKGEGREVDVAAGEDYAELRGLGIGAGRQGETCHCIWLE